MHVALARPAGLCAAPVLGARGGLLVVLVVASACSSTPPPVKLPPPDAGPGVTFSWPRDGQRDVPAHAPVVLHFSDPLALFALDGGCDTFCVEGPNGALPGTVVVVAGNTITFTPSDGYDDGVRYQVHAKSALLPSGTNLAGDPLLSFVARQARPIPGTPPAVLEFEDAPLDGGALPFLDVMPLRLLLSEPVDPATVTPATVRLTDASGTAVPSALIANGARLVVDPDQDLTAGQTYTLTLQGVKDLGGEALPTFTLPVTPKRAAAPGQALFPQTLALTPAWESGKTPPASALSGAPVNTSQTASPLIGSATLGLLAGGLKAELGDPSAFGGPIPMVVRKGQVLDLSPLAIRFGGVLESGYQTGTLHFTVLDDAVGWLTRNPFRPPEQLPDDNAPVFVDLTMDTVLTAEDAAGNGLSNQTLMGLRLLGLSTVDVDQLVVDQVGALELGTLGINAAPTSLALRLRTGATLNPPVPAAPALTATYPADGSHDAPPDAPLEAVWTAPLSLTGATLALTENGAAVPFSARTEGSTLVVVPGRRLADGAAIKLTWSGLTSLQGQPVAGSTSQLAFTTAAPPSTSAPPMIASVTTGAPCALVGGGTTSPGACVGGQNSDTPYQPFTLASNLPLRVGFTQPMRATTLVQGSSCGIGGIRIEALDANGACSGPVSGTLRASDRGFVFTPAKPWTAGARYRLVLSGGLDANCDANELCGANGAPLNTTPLSGQGTPGGTAAVLPFSATAATPDSLQPLETLPFADLNANGDLETGETPNDDNRVAMEVTGTGGIVTDASLNGSDCVPSRSGTQVCTALHAQLPVMVGAVQAKCPVDANGAPTSNGGPCVQVRVMPNVILNSSLSMNTTVIGLVPINNLPTHGLLMRVREPGGPQLGYILNEPGQTYPQFVIKQSVYLDAPDLSIPLASHDMHSKPLDILLKGPVTFLPDGRMHVALKNLADVPLTVNISAIGLSGHIDMNIPAGEMHITLVGPPLR